MLPLPLLILAICVFSLIFIISLARDLYLIFSKNQRLVLLISLLFLFPISLISTLIFIISFLLLSLASFALCFFKVEAEVPDLRPFFFTNIGLWCYKFPPKHCFSGMLKILISCIFIIQFKIL